MFNARIKLTYHGIVMGKKRKKMLKNIISTTVISIILQIVMENT